MEDSYWNQSALRRGDLQLLSQSLAHWEDVVDHRSFEHLRLHRNASSCRKTRSEEEDLLLRKRTTGIYEGRGKGGRPSIVGRFEAVEEEMWLASDK